MIDWLILRLRQLRKSRRWTQEKFAEISGISYKYYQAIESGRKRELRLSTLERLAAAYGIKIHELFHPETPPSTEGRLPAMAERKARYSVSKRKRKS